MASCAGIPQKIDPTLVQTLRLQKNGKHMRQITNFNHFYGVLNIVTLIKHDRWK